MKTMIVAAIVAALSGCGNLVVREDAVQVRTIKSGTANVLTVVEDPVDHVRCWIAYSGLSCFPMGAAEAKKP